MARLKEASKALIARWPRRWSRRGAKTRRRLRANGEHERRILRQLARIGELDVAVAAERRGLHALADQGGLGARRIHAGGHGQHASVLERDLGGHRCSGLRSAALCASCAVIGSSSPPVCRLDSSPGMNTMLLSVKARDLVEAAAREDPLGIARMNLEAVEASRLGERLHVRSAEAARGRIAPTSSVMASGLRFLQRQLDLDLVGLELASIRSSAPCRPDP